MAKYLYGASVQGIQGFIFETNKLREIAGASELIEQICTIEFKNHLKNKGISFKEDNKLIMAAGNIKYIFNSKEDCMNVVNDFAQKVMDIAPGITISQAIVKFDNEEPTLKVINDLENKLKTQRNKRVRHQGLGWMISERSRTTGHAGVKWDKKDGSVIDRAQVLKRGASISARSKLMEKLIYGHEYKSKKQKISDKVYPFDVEDIVADNKGAKWLAVVHADGNNLGLLIQRMVKNIQANNKNVKEGFTEFSNQLDAATTQSANDAYEAVIKKDYENKILEDHNNKRRLPIRPIVIGGDDLTVIVRGDLAIDFTNEFLKAFQARTAEYFTKLVSDYNLIEFKNGITACAGIAYIKPSYPFHYAVELAEELCSYSKTKAKKIDKTIVPSCLTFHKVQSSFVEDYKTIIERELKAGDIYLNAGPYSTDIKFKELRTITKLKEQVEKINRASSPKSNLRNWLSELHVNEEQATQLMNRIKTITGDYYTRELELNDIIFEDNTEKRTHINDVLTIASIENN